MKKMSGKNSFFAIGITALLFVTCTPTVTVKKPVIETVPERPITIIHSDTLVYQIAFSDQAERERFIYSFNRFLKESSFLAERYDSAGVFTMLRILPSTGQSAEPKGEGLDLAKAFFDTITPGTVTQEPPSAEPEEPRPPSGGSVRIYTPRATLDYPLAALVDAYPFTEGVGDDSLPGYFKVASAGPTFLTLRLVGKVTNGNGKTMGVLDFIDSWTRYIRERPAEGRALFYGCQGIEEFTGGREAVVRGFIAVDNTTIQIKLSKPDPAALERLRTSRTLPQSFGLGRYAVKLARDNEDVLVPNPAAAGEKPFLNEALVRRGGDANPILSFSLGRYDAMLIWSAADLDYARRNLLKNGTCSLVGRDRYFIAVQLDDAATRAALRSSLSTSELLNKFVKAEGRLIGAVASDSLAGNGAEKKAPASSAPPAEPVRIFYCKDDPVSKIIAERLLASVTQSGIKSLLLPSDRKSYESALAGQTPGCYVAWAPETVLTGKSEQLRIAVMFFGGETDESRRMEADREIPLFSIDWYLLAKEKVGLFKGMAGGIYVKQESR
jgi:hypothetical protein